MCYVTHILIISVAVSAPGFSGRSIGQGAAWATLLLSPTSTNTALSPLCSPFTFCVLFHLSRARSSLFSAWPNFNSCGPSPTLRPRRSQRRFQRPDRSTTERADGHVEYTGPREVPVAGSAGLGTLMLVMVSRRDLRAYDPATLKLPSSSEVGL